MPFHRLLAISSHCATAAAIVCGEINQIGLGSLDRWTRLGVQPPPPRRTDDADLPVRCDGIDPSGSSLILSGGAPAAWYPGRRTACEPVRQRPIAGCRGQRRPRMVPAACGVEKSFDRAARYSGRANRSAVPVVRRQQWRRRAQAPLEPRRASIAITDTTTATAQVARRHLCRMGAVALVMGAGPARTRTASRLVRDPRNGVPKEDSLKRRSAESDGRGFVPDRSRPESRRSSGDPGRRHSRLEAPLA